MTWKIIAAICSSGLIIAGAAALAFAPTESGPSLSNSTTATTTTSPPTTMPRPPGYMGGYRQKTRGWLSQPRDAARVAQHMLVRLEVVTGNLRVHRTFQKETQHRVVREIRLVEREHRCPVGLFLELVIALGAGPQRLAHRDVARQLVQIRLGHGLPGSSLAARQQVFGHLENARAHQTLAGVVALVENLHAARRPLKDPRFGRVRWHWRMQHPPHPSRRRVDMESHCVGLHYGSPQVFQTVTVSAGGREAGRKSVPIV